MNGPSPWVAHNDMAPPHTPDARTAGVPDGALVAAADPRAMTPPPSGLSFGDAFGALVRSPGWLASAFTGGLIAFIPLLGQLVLYGWCGEILKRTSLGYAQPVPPLRLSDTGYWLKRGVAPFIGNLAYGTALGLAINVVMVPAVLLVIALQAVFGAAAGVAGMLGMFGLLTIGLFLMMPVYSAAMTTAELSDDVGAAFRFDQVFGYAKGTWRGQLAAALGTQFIGGALVLAGMLALGIGILPAMSITFVATAHLRGQVYRNWLARGGAPLPALPPQMAPAEAAAQLPPGR